MKSLSFAIAFAITSLLCILTNADEVQQKSPRNVLVTIRPIYDWTVQVLGSHTNDWKLTLLQKSGVDLHSFKPSAQDVADVSHCDFFIYVGGESDEWTESLLKHKQNPNQMSLNLIEFLGSDVKTEEIVEGMQAEEHNHAHVHNHDTEEAEEHDHADEEEKDEHIWLSLRLASRSVSKIANDLCTLDPVNAADYKANAAAYVARLQDLDNRYKTMVSKAKRKTMLVADRFPFRYLAEDYGLSYYAAFVGCSAESEASFKTVVFLAKKVDELQLPYIVTLESANDKIAQTVIRTSKTHSAKIKKLDSLQSLNGENYITTMEKNLSVLSIILN